MKKIISLFKRNYDGDRLVRNEVIEGAEWGAGRNPIGEHRDIHNAITLQQAWSIDALQAGCHCPFPSPGMVHFLDCPLNDWHPA